MVTAVANARQSVRAPVRTARKFGLLSVVDVTDGGDMYWMLGGLTAEGEDCSKPNAGTIGCAPSAAKTSGSWYSDLESDPWLSYMYETCRTVGRFSESSERLRARFLAAEQSAVEKGFQDNVLDGTTSIGGFASPALAIGALEAEAAREYGGQVILHLPFEVAAQVAGMFHREGDHLETVGGNLVSIGNYDAEAEAGTTVAPIVYATGAVSLYRSALAEAGPVFDDSNNYFALIERAYAALVDCFTASATATLCGCP